MKVALVGAGRMGLPIGERVAAAGHDVVVLVRSAATRSRVVEAGLPVTDSLIEAVGEADVVVVAVLDDAQVRQVCLGPEGVLARMRPGAILVQHTTGHPATAEDLAAAGAARGIGVLDAALSGGPHDVAAGRLTLWVGGAQADLERVRPVLSAYAEPIIAVGPVGAGQRVKLVNNALFVAQVGLATEAVRVAQGLGLSETAILAALPHGSGASRALGVVAHGGVGAVAGRIGALMAKDIDVVREVAARAGADLGTLGAVLDSAAVEERVLGR